VRINPQGVAGRGYGLDFSDPNIDWSRAVPPPSGFLSAPPPPKPSLAELVNAHNPSWIFNYPLPEDHPNLTRRPPPPARRTKAPPQEPPVRRPWEGERGTAASIATSSSGNAQPTPRGSGAQPKPKVSSTSNRVRPKPSQDPSIPQPRQGTPAQAQAPPQPQAQAPAQSTRSRLAELLEAQQLIEAQERSALELILAEEGADNRRPSPSSHQRSAGTTRAVVGARQPGPSTPPPRSEPTEASEPAWLHAPSDSSPAANHSAPINTTMDGSPLSPRIHQDPVATRSSPGRGSEAVPAGGRPQIAGGGGGQRLDQPAGAVTRREANAMREIFGGASPPQQQPRQSRPPQGGHNHPSPGQRRGQATAGGNSQQGEWELNDFSYEALLELGSMAVSTGLSRAQLAKYKPKPYQKPLVSKKSSTPSMHPSSRPGSRISRSNDTKPSTAGGSGGVKGHGDDDDAECTVCLDVVEVGQDSLTLPCSHAFHHKCIIQWLSRTNRCPTCRYEIQRQKEK
jgi:hypothetical protein